MLIRNREMNKDYLSETKTINYGDPDLDERLVSILNNSSNILEITTDFAMR